METKVIPGAQSGYVLKLVISCFSQTQYYFFFCTLESPLPDHQYYNIFYYSLLEDSLFYCSLFIKVKCKVVPMLH